MVPRLAVLLCLATLSAVGAAPEPVDLDLPHWTSQSQQPADGTAVYRDGAFVLQRGASAGGYMLRVYRDVPITPRGIYLLTYLVKVSGEGSAAGLVFCGDRAGQWDERQPTTTEAKRQGDFSQVKTVITAPATAVRFRVDLRADGARTTVTYKDITLVCLGQQPELTVTPSDAAVTLDGRLDDPLWTSALRFSPFRVLGDVARPSAVDNEALLALKDGWLYLGYRLAAPEPARLKATQPTTADRLAPIGIYTDDCTETFLSTDQESFAHVLVNAAGARHWDQQNHSRSSATWYPSPFAGFTGEWDAQAAIGQREWTCELRVRLTDLFGGPVGGDRPLYVNFTRHRTDSAEENLTWAPLSGQFYAVPRQFPAVTLKLPPLAAPTGGAPVATASTFTQRFGVPDLLLAGVPVRLDRRDGAWRLPAQLAIDEQGVAIDGGVKATLSEALTVPGGGRATVSLRLGEPAADGLRAEQRAKLTGPEAFRLELAPGRAVITGRSRDGVLRGVATLALMANRARYTPGAALPALTLYDAPRLPFRGLMVQLTKRVVDVACLLRINKLLVYLDSFGGPTVFPFDSYPIGGKGTTKAELQELFAYARARGIEPIPYFASWGRVQYLKHMPGGAKLLVDDVDVIQQGYRNLDVANPETHRVMLALQAEIIDTLKPESFCVAMDEAHYGHMVTSPAAKAKGWKPSDWFAEALNVNAAFLRARGVKMYVWGDMIDPGQNGGQMDQNGPALLARLPKDMAIFDWKYSGKEETTVDYPSIAMFRQAKLDTIGAAWFAPKSLPRLARSIAQHGGQGLLLTAWNSSAPEAMPAEWIRACALTAWYGWSPEDTDLTHWTFVPDAVMQGAAYWPKDLRAAGATRYLPAPATLVSGEPLARLVGLPPRLDATFLGTAFANYRGAGARVFRLNGQPAAAVVRGGGAGLRNGDFGRGLAGWTVEIPDQECLFAVVDGRLKVTRVAGNAFRRILQDFRLDDQKEYVIRYRVKTAAPGVARAWTYSGDANFRWDLPKSVHATSAAREWTTQELVLPPKYAAARICFTVDGPGGVAWFSDVEVVERGAAPAAAAPPASLPVGGTARVLTFWHAVNRQPLRVDEMHANLRQFANVLAGEYRIAYTDGTSESVPLVYRLNIVAANDPNLGRQTEIGLFGTLNGSTFVNVPTLTWVNPHPEKAIATITLRPGESKDMAVLLFGVTAED